MQLTAAAVIAIGIIGFTAQSFAEPPIHALIITGHNNHNWQYTSQLHKDTLEATGRFEVDITDTPEQTLTDARQLGRYQVFVLDYNDFGNPKRWGDAAEKNFVEAVKNGTGVVAIHSANNAFKGWTEYEQMLALMWRDGTGHGRFHKFDVTFTDESHPITKGLATFKNHPDELYHRLVNEQDVQFQVLAMAHSSKESGGTGNDEPMAIVLQYGKGRVFATPLGHVWNNSDDTKASICDPQFKILLCRGAEWAATGNVTLGTEWRDVRPHNQLSTGEEKDGWVSLFDGKSADQFRGFKNDAFLNNGWAIRDGALCHEAGQGGGDIITAEEFGDFEFACDWKVAPGGNSGVIYRCDTKHDQTWQTGPEMQILDDAKHADGKNEKTRAGTLYGLYPCLFDVSRPAGEWNHARIIVRGSHIEHWLNGYKVVSCDLNSEDYKRLRAESKFKDMPEFGTLSSGHIALQDHGDEVCFRDIKVKRLN